MHWWEMSDELLGHPQHHALQAMMPGRPSLFFLFFFFFLNFKPKLFLTNLPWQRRLTGDRQLAAVLAAEKYFWDPDFISQVCSGISLLFLALQRGQRAWTPGHNCPSPRTACQRFHAAFAFNLAADIWNLKLKGIPQMGFEGHPNTTLNLLYFVP